jgi:hypothetical protein
VVAGVTATAGGVIFTGDSNGNFLVFNSTTGELIHKTPTGGALAGGVVTYDASGRQYVAFASGNVSRMAFGALGLPSVVIMALGDGKKASAAPAAGRSQAGGSARSTGRSQAAGAPPAPGQPPAAPSQAGAGDLGTPNHACRSCTPPSWMSGRSPTWPLMCRRILRIEWLSRLRSLCYYSSRMNRAAHSYRFTYFYWPKPIGGRRAALD